MNLQANAPATPPAYDAAAIEPKWRARWERDDLYRATDDDDDDRPRYYLLTMLPYTSGDLHIGHWFAMAPSDVTARWRRMQGKNVLFPMGFDAFGLPAENAAIREGVHPMQWTAQNIDRMRTQLKVMGASFDWSREIITASPDFYTWTQWWFLQLLKHGLAYRKQAPANWCPGCQTVLANEQVIRDAEGVGRCERSDDIVETRDLEQWFFRITSYADELLDFSGMEWPERIKAMQTNWIGRSEGAAITFPLERDDGSAQPVPDHGSTGSPRTVGLPRTADTPPTADSPAHDPVDAISVFTTRPDTVFGVSFLVLAPENPLVTRLTTSAQHAHVDAYVQASRRATEIERQARDRPKSGVFTGAYARHPFTDQRIPIWIADYVLLSYGSGAVMGVPAHDARDFAFASQYGLEIPVVVAPPDWDGESLPDAYTDPGVLVNSGSFDGTPSEQGQVAVSAALKDINLGGPAVTYRLRDWLISRQRYWGAPIPIVYCDHCGIVPVPEDHLPVLLPEDAEFLPTGDSPLARHEVFVHTACPECDGPARRETDTMDTFMCSSWYMFRYVDPHNDSAPIAPELAAQWLPVDQYTGGAEHAVMHLLYARFFTKAARDMGVLTFDEPFTRLFTQGIVVKDGHKMSKSRGNVVTPDDWVARLGTDTVRCYLMFLGPWDQGGDWDDSGIHGLARWLNRVWSLVLTPDGSGDDARSAATIRGLTHRMIRKVTEDIQAFRFNTMLAAMMEFTNALSRARDDGAVDAAAWDEAIESLVLCLAPSAPHIAEELWERMGRPYSVHTSKWPGWDAGLAQEESITLVVQVNGKVRDRITLAADISESDARTAAEDSARVQAHLVGKSVRKVIYVPEKLINFVVR